MEILEDHAEFNTTAFTACDLTKQAAADILFEQVFFQRAIFHLTRFSRVRLFDVRAANSDFSGAIWENSRLRRVEFIGCRLIGIQLLEAHLEHVYFKECNLESAVFASAVFKTARFEGCNLRDASFEQADLSGTIFHKCDLSKANLARVKLPNADFRGSLLNGMKAGPEDLRGAIIDAAQVLQVVALLGVVVKDEDDH